MKSIVILSALFLSPFFYSIAQEVTTQEHFNNAKKGNAVIMFTTPTCSPCQQIKPQFRALSSPYASLYIVNVDSSNPVGFSIANQYEVRSYPTFLFLKDGKKIDKFIGIDQFQEKFNTTIQKAFGGTGQRQLSVAAPRTPRTSRQRRSKKKCGRRCKCPKMNKANNTCQGCKPDCNC